jgi:ribosomal protein S18 acetylase RimI-like enzyme
MMIYYLEKVLNKIIDASSDDDLLKNVQKFNDDVEMLFTYFAYPVSYKYIQSLLKHKSNKCAFLHIGSEPFDIYNCVTGLIYGFYKGTEGSLSARQERSSLSGSAQSGNAVSLSGSKSGTEGSLSESALKKTCYIMLICTHPDHQNKGYATQMLKTFIESMRGKVDSIVLSSVDYAVSYYQHIGFEAVDDNINNYPYLSYFEASSPDKITTIMEYKL